MPTGLHASAPKLAALATVGSRSWGAGTRTPTSWVTTRLATLTTHPSKVPAPREPAWIAISQDGGIRTHALRLPRPADYQTFRRPEQVGPEGLEPSPRWLRARYAAANTWDPFIHVSVGSEGVEPTPHGLKDRYAAITPRPQWKSQRTFPKRSQHRTHSSRNVNTPSSPGRSCTCHRRRIRSPCSCYNTGPNSRGAGSRTQYFERPMLAELPFPFTPRSGVSDQ